MNTPTPWRWNILPAIMAAAFTPKPNLPLPIWASLQGKAHGGGVYLDRRMTTRPGFYNPDEYPWTWEFQEIIRTREVWEKEIDGATVIVDPGTEGAASMRVHQVDIMKGTQTGVTESALNGVRYYAVNDPQNVIFAIDNARQAGEVNEIRLQPTLKRLGQKIFTDNKDDAAKFILKLRRMIVWFLGSYNEASATQKMAETVILDELEEHGNSDVNDWRSRMKTSDRRLLIAMSKPKFTNGPIDREYRNGSMHVAEIPCPHCGGFQQLEQDNMKFSHCKNILGEWDFNRVLLETFFECVHCKKPIEERNKRWFNDRSRRRWRRTNFQKAEPNHISFHIPDFLSYDESVTWGRLAVEYINSKGDSEKRRTYRNHHEGLPYEERAIKTQIADLLVLRSTYPRGVLPWLPRAIILGADVGLNYVKWCVIAMRSTLMPPERDTKHKGLDALQAIIDRQSGGTVWEPTGFPSEAAIIDFGQELAPADVVKLIETRQFVCAEDQKSYGITIGGMDAKYKKLEVQQACLKSRRRLWPTAGLPSDLSLRSVNFSHIPMAPQWFGTITYNDRDAKHELYTERIGSWSQWRQLGCPADPNQQPVGSPLHYFKELSDAPNSPYLEFLNEHTKENLVEVPGVHSARQFIWKRSGPNHWPDAIKVALVMWRYFTAPQ
jgi:hypothetical protein